MSPAPSTRRPGRRSAPLAACLLAASLLAGCTTSTNTDSATADDTKPKQPKQSTQDNELGSIGIVTDSYGVKIVHDDWAELGYRWQWSAKPITAGKPRITHIDHLGETIAIQSVDSWTALLDADTGSSLWQVRNTGPLTEFVDNFRVNDVLVSCGRPELFLMELGSGNLIARQPVDVVVSTPPAIYGGLAVFGTPTGEVLCHRFGTPAGDPLPPPFDSGAKQWGYLLEGAIQAAPVRMGRTAGIVTQTGEVFFVDIPSGSGRGRARISGRMATDPVTDGDTMYVASLDQSIYAFEPNSSTYRWRYRTDAPLTTQPTWHDGVLYVHVASEGLVAFDVSQNAKDAGNLGAKLWANPDLDGQVITLRSDELVVWNGRTARLVDRVAGDDLDAVDFPQFTRLATSGLDDGHIYAVAPNGMIAKFSPK